MSKPDFEALMQEGADNFMIEHLSNAEGELDTDGIREFLGEDAEGLSDEQLDTMYAEAKDGETDGAGEGDEGSGSETVSEDAGSGETGEEGEKVPSGDEGTGEAVVEAPEWSSPTWHLVNKEGEKVDSIDELSAKELLDLSIGYTVNKQGQKSTIEELVNHRTYSVVDQQRIQHLLQERNTAGGKLRTQEQELKDLRDKQKFSEWIMRDATGKRFLEAQEKFEAALLELGPEEAKLEATSAKELADYHAEGEREYQSQIVPTLQAMAQQYSGDGQVADLAYQTNVLGQFDALAKHLIAAEGDMLTQERLASIIQVDLPRAAMEGGLHPIQAGGVAAVEDERVTALEAELANLKLAGTKSKLEEAPDSGSGSGPAGSSSTGFDTSKFKSWAEIQEKVLDNDDENLGM